MQQFQDYLDNLPFTKAIKSRIVQIIELNKKFYDEEILDILICDYKNSDNSPVYSSLWLFTAKSFIECKNFVNYFDFDITPIASKLHYCSMDFTDYDLETANDNSKINIHMKFNTEIVGDIVATGVNCDHALYIYKKHIIANLK